MIGTVLQAENSPYSNSPSASAPVERLQESIVKYRELINTENVHLTSLRDVEEFTRPGENAFKVYPNQSSNLVLRDNTKESADSSKDITGEQAEKIVINEQRIDHMSLDLQELKTTLMYKEEELEKMKKTVGEQEKTIKRLEAVEGKKKDLSEDQRRQLMNRLKDEAIIAGMRNGV